MCPLYDTSKGVLTREDYTSGVPAIVAGPWIGVVVRDGLVLPFRLVDCDCSTYSNLRESRINVTGPWDEEDSFRGTIRSGMLMSGTHLICKADVHHSAKFSVCSGPLRYMDIRSSARAS